ncbi:MAG TPA: hypothetical protein VK470_07315 [Bacteroidota bacterium]|nr:hypothetical protein [Bacteroidota bacterium]
MKLYNIVSVGTSLLFVFLFAQLFFTPVSFVEGIGLQSSTATTILCRRASMFMLGLSVLLFSVRRLPHSAMRQAICLSTGITMTGLAILSSTELMRGRVNDSMWTAIIIESILGILFWIVYFNNLKNSTTHS